MAARSSLHRSSQSSAACRAASSSSSTASWIAIVTATAISALGLVPLAAAISGHLLGPLTAVQRCVLFAAAILLLVPTPGIAGSAALFPVLGAALLAVIAFLNRKQKQA